MQWMTVVVVIGLCWCQVDATKGLNASECHRRMRSDWYDTKKYTAYALTEEEKACLKPADIEERQGGSSCARKECRTLTDSERSRLWACFDGLTTAPGGGGLSVYHVFLSQHRQRMAPSAHFGPCFPGWHSEYLQKFEKALQSIDSSCCLCYWDSSLDSPLPDFGDSAIWTAPYFGNNNGYVTTGVGANFPAVLPECARTWSRLYRNVEGGNNGLLYNRNKISSIYGASFDSLMQPYPNNMFSSDHDQVHGSVGGHMAIISCSPVDPVFWFHHCFVDYLWTKYRELHPTVQYPTDGEVPPGHGANDPLRPFEGKRCRDGYNNGYIPDNHHYEDSPSTIRCTSHADCHSRVLFCAGGSCTACVQEGGRMRANWADRGCYIPSCATPKNDGNVCRCAS